MIQQDANPRSLHTRMLKSGKVDLKMKFVDSANSVPAKKRTVQLDVPFDYGKGTQLDTETAFRNIQPSSNYMGNAFTYPGSPVI